MLTLEPFQFSNPSPDTRYNKCPFSDLTLGMKKANFVSISHLRNNICAFLAYSFLAPSKFRITALTEPLPSYPSLAAAVL